MLFRKIRIRLLLNNLLVFTLVFSGAAIAVRLVFVQSLQRQLGAKLIALGQGISSEAELGSDGFLEIEDEDKDLIQTVLDDQQSFEWFDLQGNSVERMGEFFPQKVMDTERLSRLEHSEEYGIYYVTLSVLDEDTRREIGYLRVSELKNRFNRTMLQLDVGLVVGAIAALILSSIGILWLNQQTMKHIEASFQRLKQFTADASHELRNPLMAISSNAEVSLKYTENMREEDRSAMLAILSASEQMRHLTEDLLLLARTDKVSPVQASPLNLSELLKKLVLLYRVQAEEKDIKLISEIYPELRVAGDLPNLTRAFTNLIQNAICYTSAGGEISIKARRLNNKIEVTVSDTGRGIEQENLENIFERFWQADQTRRYSDGGAGLGLSITRAIVQSHRGRIDVSSTLGCGSCFVVQLPAEPIANK